MYKQSVHMSMPSELLTLCSILKLEGLECYVDGSTVKETL